MKNKVILSELSEDQITAILMEKLGEKNLVGLYVSKYANHSVLSSYFTYDEVYSDLMLSITNTIVKRREFLDLEKMNELRNKKVLDLKEVKTLKELMDKEYTIGESVDFSTVGNLVGYTVTSFKNRMKDIYRSMTETKKNQVNSLEVYDSVIDSPLANGDMRMKRLINSNNTVSEGTQLRIQDKNFQTQIKKEIASDRDEVKNALVTILSDLKEDNEPLFHILYGVYVEGHSWEAMRKDREVSFNELRNMKKVVKELLERNNINREYYESSQLSDCEAVDYYYRECDSIKKQRKLKLVDEKVAA